MSAALIAGVVASSISSGTSLIYATLGEIVETQRKRSDDVTPSPT